MASQCQPKSAQGVAPSMEPKASPAAAAGGSASVAASIVNLTKNVLGAGVLSLSSGIAQGTGLGTACIVLMVAGCLSAIMFLAIGRACANTGQTTFKGVGTVAVSSSFASLVNITVVSKTFLTSLVNSMVISSSFSQMLPAFGYPAEPAKVLVTISVLVLLPLCLLKDLSSLKPFSFAGTLGMVYSLTFMTLRYCDGSYTKGGRFWDTATHTPFFEGGPEIFAFSDKTISLVCVACIAYLAHYNAPRFYQELADRTKFPMVVGASFGICMALSLGFMVAGYLTFGQATEGNVLSNYSPLDPLATLARAMVGGSILSSYPLVFAGLRDNTMDLLALPSRARVPLTMALLAAVTALALRVESLNTLLSLTGAVYGALLIYIYPAVIFLFSGKSWLLSRLFMCLMLPAGLLLCIGGVASAFPA